MALIRQGETRGHPSRLTPFEVAPIDCCDREVHSRIPSNTYRWINGVLSKSFEPSKVARCWLNAGPAISQGREEKRQIAETKIVLSQRDLPALSLSNHNIERRVVITARGITRTAICRKVRCIPRGFANRANHTRAAAYWTAAKIK